MMKFRENEEAVSPVIGVILMVAITVILAAVIAAFVFGMSENIPENKEVFLTTKMGENATSKIMIVTLQGGKDLPALTSLVYKINEGNETSIDPLRDGGVFEAPFEVGYSGKFSLEAATRESNTIIIRGKFADGTVQTLVVKEIGSIS